MHMKNHITKMGWGVLAMLFVTGCAVSELTPELPTPTPAEVEQYNAVAPYEEQIVCLMEAELGSRFKRRKCYTRGYLESRDNQGTAVVEAMRQDGLINNPVFGGR